MAVMKFKNENFEEEVMKSNIPVVVDFYADWCGPCKMMSPIIDEIANEMGETVKVGKVNVDEEQSLAIQFGVMSIPTIVIIKNGKVTKTFVGVQNKENIIKELK